MQYSEAFEYYGAILKNPQWSVSSYNSKNELIVSLWYGLFERHEGETIRYIDRVSRWSGNGNREFRKNIDIAFNRSHTIRAIITHTKMPCASKEIRSARKIRKTFLVEKDLFGKVTLWDGDNYEITFIRKKS